MVEGVRIKSLGENLSLCKTNNNSTYHLLSTYCVLESWASMLAATLQGRFCYRPHFINEKIEALKANLLINGRARFTPVDTCKVLSARAQPMFELIFTIP